LGSVVYLSDTSQNLKTLTVSLAHCQLPFHSHLHASPWRHVEMPVSPRSWSAGNTSLLRCKDTRRRSVRVHFPGAAVID
jgi:hypothetical protein